MKQDTYEINPTLNIIFFLPLPSSSYSHIRYIFTFLYFFFIVLCRSTPKTKRTFTFLWSNKENLCLLTLEPSPQTLHSTITFTFESNKRDEQNNDRSILVDCFLSIPQESRDPLKTINPTQINNSQNPWKKGYQNPSSLLLLMREVVQKNKKGN